MNLLVVFECRDRTDPQDLTWIEQLASKAEDVGADKTVAVSVEGFKASAERMAERFGIELRTLKSVSSDDVPGWLKLTEVSVTETQTSIYGLEIDTFPDTPPLTESAQEGMAGTGEDLSFHFTDGTVMTGRALAESIRESFDWSYIEEAADQGPQRVAFLVSGDAPTVGIETEEGVFPLARMTVHFECRVERRFYPVTRVRRYQVQDSYVEMVEADVLLKGKPAIIGFWRSPDGEVSIAIKPTEDIVLDLFLDIQGREAN